MNRSTSSSADTRTLVLRLLLEKGDYPTRRLNAVAEQVGLDNRNRAFARELLAGTIRRRRTLDAIFKPFSKRRTVEPAVLWTLRLALYQRFFMDQVPNYAAYNATLDAARGLLKRAVGFVNAILRSIERSAQQIEAAEFVRHPHTFQTGRHFWEFNRPLFADPKEHAEEYWATVLSYPDFLVSRWWESNGEESTIQRMHAMNGPPPMWLRVNTNRIDRDAVMRMFMEHKIGTEVGPSANSLMLQTPGREIARLPGFAEGLWSVQDLSAQKAIQMAAPRPGENVLDLCAAPGGKAFAAFESMQGEGFLLACDVDEKRLALVEQDQKRLGHNIETRAIRVPQTDIRTLRPPTGEWDLILMDVPCSNTGVLGRRPEARWRFGKSELQQTVKIQKELVRWALPGLLSSKTRVLWSTCSLEPEENEAGAERAARRGGLHPTLSEGVEPTTEHGGGFAAMLQASDGLVSK